MAEYDYLHMFCGKRSELWNVACILYEKSELAERLNIGGEGENQWCMQVLDNLLIHFDDQLALHLLYVIMRFISQ